MTAILEKLFGEMTVLGFLSLTTFLVTKMSFFQALNDFIFEEDGELLEILETVHFALFFIMIFYLVQVLVFVRRAIATEQEWSRMDRLAMHRRHQDPSYPADEEQRLFEALRKEFILERDVEPPFSPAPQAHRVSEDFPFGRYLSISLGQFLTHTVELDEMTLLFFAVAALGYYLVGFLIDEDETMLAWAWVGLGWAVFIFNLYFDRHVTQLKRAFATSEADVSDSAHSSQLLELKSTLPAWCNVNLDMYMQTRPFLAQWFGGGRPNRQQALFWMGKNGKQCYLIILQVNLIFTGLYCAMHLIDYVYVMIDKPLHVFVLYLVLAVLPIVGMAFNRKNLITNLAQVFSLGVYRRPQVVSAVLREEKTAQVIRSFVILQKLRKTTKGGQSGSVGQRQFDYAQVSQIIRSFDMCDADGDGFIEHEELRQLVVRLGGPTSDDTLQKAIEALDENKDGKISKEEFLKWYAENAADDDLTDHERAVELFSMFDDDGDKEITIGEFKRKVDAMNAGLSVDDVGAIIHELDTDGSGTIGVHEFEILVQRYYPKELYEHQFE